MRFCITFVVLNRPYSTIRNQSEIDNIPQKPENLRFAPFIIFNFYFAFLICTIDNTITYSLSSPYYVTKTSTNSSAVSLSRVSRDQYTALLLAEVLVT